MHVLIANGDLYAMGPIMPLRTEMPRRYLQSLKAYVQERRHRLRGAKTDQAEQDRLDSWDTWVDSLVSQSRDLRSDSQNRLSTETNPRAGDESFVQLHPPHLTATGGPAPGMHKSLSRQGPVIYSPGPSESPDDSEEDAANDISVLVMPRHQADALQDEASSSTISGFAIAWSSGRMDVGLMARAPEPAWAESEVSSSFFC